MLSLPVQMKDRIQVLEAQMKELNAQRATVARNEASQLSKGQLAEIAQGERATQSDMGGPKSPMS